MSRYDARVDYYSILGIATTATRPEIKVAYNKLAKKHHPDLNTSGSREKFEEATRARDVLLDDGVRRIYDMERSEGWSSVRSSSGFGGFNKTKYKAGFEPRRGPRPGTPKQIQVSVVSRKETSQGGVKRRKYKVCLGRSTSMSCEY